MSHTARVGVFMLVALVIVGVFIVKIEEFPIGAKGGRVRVQAVFPSVAGLDEKSPVRVAGVRVGIVETITLQGDRALVTLALDRALQLHQGARAAVTSLGLLGDKYVELFPGNLAAPPLPSGTVLSGTSPIGFDEALRSFSDIEEDVKAITASLRQSLGGPEGAKRLDEIVENVRKVTADLRLVIEANRTNVDSTMENFRSFSETLKTELPRIAEKMNRLADRVDAVVAENRENVHDSIANIKDLSARLRTSADNLNEISGKIARGEGSVGKLVNDPATVDNLNTALKSAKGAADSLTNTLGRAERWKLNVNIRTEALVSLPSQHNSRSTMGFDLATSPERFFRLEFVSPPYQRTTTSTETVTTTLPGGQQQTYTQEVTRAAGTYTLNFQVGYIFHGFNLRAGLFESAGGVGIDKLVANDRLRLTFEAYDFTRESKPPHLRLEGRYLFNRNLFAYAGWDDPTWKERSTALFGLGVTWGDEDIKYLLGTAAAATPR